MLAALLEVPGNVNEWDRWAFHNRTANDLIRQAMQSQKGVALTEYPLYPIDISSPSQWLWWNQLAHQEFLAPLNLQSHDIESADFKNPAELEAWIYLNYKELYDASEALGVS